MKLPLKLLLSLLILALAFPADWSILGPLIILAFWANRGHFGRQMLWLMGLVFVDSVVDFFVFDMVYAVVQLAVALSIPVLWMYNGQRGKSPRFNRFLKWFFYLYYPLHLTVLGVLSFCGVFPL